MHLPIQLVQRVPAVKKPEPEPGCSPNIVMVIKRQTITVLVHVLSWRIQGPI